MTEESTDVMVIDAEYVQLGSVRTAGPADVVRKASDVATELAKVIKSQKLATNIQGREFVRVEGWATCGAMLGVMPREVSVRRYDDGTYEATVELIRSNDGAIIGRGSAICGMDEAWGNRKEYARRSMAITRATGKAYRLAFSWIMTLAGYEATPAEEMDGVTDDAKPTRRQQPRQPALSKLYQAFAERYAEALALGIDAEPLPDDADRDTVIERGKELAAKIKEAKENARKFDAETITAVVEAGLSTNVHSVNGALAHSDLTASDEVDGVLEWFRHYRESRDAGADTPEAATVANTWLESKMND